MQYHLDGFRPGDPAVADADDAVTQAGPDLPLPESVDVLIVGCGPTGLTLATQLAAFPEISVCVVDAKPGPLTLGQADGIACRTMEMFRAFGFAERVLKESYWVNETVFWKPDPNDPAAIARSSRIQDVEDGLSEFPHVILNQARVHDFFLQTMRNSPSGLTPHYSRSLDALEISSDRNQPTVASFARVDEGHEGESETVTARFVVGCDGARSATRRLMGLTLEGDAANQAWGVMDVLAVTDFPDVRFKAVVHSSDEGNLLIIPREGGYLVRLYIELDKLGEGERARDRDITIEQLIEAGQRILAPYTLDVQEVAWWSIYEIGQRLCDSYDNIDSSIDLDLRDEAPRVFIAGDACHTHSPKAGQGMNVSMRDAFNLGWKLAAVLRGQSRPDILHTYSAERHGVAKELIEFDREFAEMFSAKPKTSIDEIDGVDPLEFQRYFQQQGRFTAGVSTTYMPSLLVGRRTHQHLAAGFEIGTRFHSAPVIRAGDAKPLELGHVVDADGRWRLFAFSDEDAIASNSRLWRLCSFLVDDPASPVRLYTPDGANVDEVIDVRAIVQSTHEEVVSGELPTILRPAKGRIGLVDYEKVFVPDQRAGNGIFEARGVSRSSGAMVIVRPDQHVAHVLPLDGHRELADFFSAFMIEAGTGGAGRGPVIGF